MNYAPSPYGVANGGNNTPILYKSTDGGETWSAVSTSPNISGARIAVEPGSGAVLAAGEKGLWRSTDGGKSFTCVMEGLVTSVTTCLTKPGTAWATKLDGLYRSTDGGATFVNLNASGYPTGEKAYPAQVTVSPADPNTVYVATDYQTWAYALGKATNFAGDCSYYYSHDGGATFEKAYIDRSNTFYNHVNHQAYIAAHPTDKNRVLALGGDVIIHSTDGGENYSEVGSGYNGGCWTGMGINLNDSNLIMLSNQDYTGAFSADGGKTWKSLLNIGNKLTLYSYGCYPVSASVLLIVARDDNNLYKKGAGKYVLMRSEDGGKTWAFITRTTENNVANEGPYGSSFLRVSPTTRELYTIGSCRGLWKTKP